MTGARNALITGSGNALSLIPVTHVRLMLEARGIGRGIALRLAKDGFNVVVNDIAYFLCNSGRPLKADNELSALQAQGEATAQELRSMGVKSSFIIADVSSATEVERMVKQAAHDIGPLTVCIANAGIAEVKSILDTTNEDWDRTFATNVRGVFNVYKYSAAQMIQQNTGGGKIISAGSIVAFRPYAMMAAYGASKWAVRGLTQAAAQEFAPYNITVNAYAPGIVGTKMWEAIDHEYNKIEYGQTLKPGELMAQQVKALTAMGRVGTEEDVASMVSFLAGPDSNFCTGQMFLVDGGVSPLSAQPAAAC